MCNDSELIGIQLCVMCMCCPNLFFSVKKCSKHCQKLKASAMTVSPIMCDTHVLPESLCNLSADLRMQGGQKALRPKLKVESESDKRESATTVTVN